MWSFTALVSIVTFLFLHFWCVAQRKQAIWRHHLELGETIMDLLNFLWQVTTNSARETAAIHSCQVTILLPSLYLVFTSVSACNLEHPPVRSKAKTWHQQPTSLQFSHASQHCFPVHQSNDLPTPSQAHRITVTLLLSLPYLNQCIVSKVPLPLTLYKKSSS